MRDAFRPSIARESALVATAGRWASCALGFAVVLVAAANAYLVLSRGGRTLASIGAALACTCAAGALLILAILRAEDARLSRELRTARTGTPLLRALVTRRRDALPVLGRLFSARVGAAAVLLAAGERLRAQAELASASPLMQGGRIDLVRAVVEADLERALGTESARSRSVRRLRAMGRIGHREADLYRVHVLVKGILEQGDTAAGGIVAAELAQAEDEEERIYATWLRVWFDLDADESLGATWAPLGEGQARWAALVARAHGAMRLVEKLEQRLLAIAHPGRQE